MLNKEIIMYAINKVKHEENHPYLVDFGDFAILNKNAFDIFISTKKEDSSIIKTIIHLILSDTKTERSYFFYKIYNGFILLEKDSSVLIGKFRFTLHFSDIKITSNQIEYNYLLKFSYFNITNKDIEEIINLGWKNATVEDKEKE